MTTSTTKHYEIRLQGFLDARWGDRFEELTITLEWDLDGYSNSAS